MLVSKNGKNTLITRGAAAVLSLSLPLFPTRVLLAKCYKYVDLMKILNLWYWSAS